MIGQAHVTEPLMTALRAERIGHAYLFSGPRGCGKTTSARILARCLNCVNGPTDNPCGTCPSCVELSRDGGGSLDVVEIDAASHGGVDDARDLRERAVFAPARDRYKIFIIDEAHMVTPGGFNALLKIVEEPPPHVKFIFATTEPEKVIGTIRSRTHHYPFRLIAPGTLIDYVQQLCDSESVVVEPGVLPLVVRAGGGSVRDTLSILDQLIAGSENGNVSLARATGLLGFTSTELIDEVVLALSSGDQAAAFGATDRVVQTGQDPRRFVEDLLERLRDLIIIAATSVQGASAVFRGVPEDQLRRMFEQSQAFAPGQLSRIADTVSNTLDTMVGATAPRLHLELMIARALLVQGAGQSGSAESSHVSARGQVPAAAASNPVRGAAAEPQPAASSPSAQPPGPTQMQAAAQEQAPAQMQAPTSTAAPAPAQPPGGVSGAASASGGAPHSATGSAAPAVDVIAAMRSARDFLKSDGAGAQRPPLVPLGGHAPTAPSASTGHTVPESQPPNPAAAELESPSSFGEESPHLATAEPESSSSFGAQSPNLTPAEQVSLHELLDIWPDLLDELLEHDRDAWNAVRAVQPLELRGETLVVGISSESDLQTFKSAGAGPLREAIVGALGMTVKYLPRKVAPTEPPAAAPQGDAAPPAPEEPSLAEPPFEPEPEPQPEPAPEPEPQPAPAPEPEPVQTPRADPPGFTRYGESVVREVLGARFIEERPLPEGFIR